MTFEGHFGDVLIVVSLCAQLARDLLAIAKFLVSLVFVYRIFLIFGPLTTSHRPCANQIGCRLRRKKITRFADQCTKALNWSGGQSDISLLIYWSCKFRFINIRSTFSCKPKPGCGLRWE